MKKHFDSLTSYYTALTWHYAVLTSYYAVLLSISIANLWTQSEAISWTIIGMNIFSYLLLLYYELPELWYQASKYISKRYVVAEQKFNRWIKRSRINEIKYFWKDPAYRKVWIDTIIFRKKYPKENYRIYRVIDTPGCYNSNY